MDIVTIKAWMADHVFVTVGMAMGLAILLVLVAHHFIKSFYERLFEFNTVCGVGLSGLTLYLGSTGGDRSLVWIGLAILATTIVGFLAGRKMHGRVKSKLDSLDKDHKRLKENSAIRLTLEPASGRKVETGKA